MAGGGRKGQAMRIQEFTYQEIARLNRMIGIALMSGKVEFDEISESVFNKVTEEICRSIEKEGREDGSKATGYGFGSSDSSHQDGIGEGQRNAR